MIELQGLQHIGYAVFAIVMAYSVWVAILFEKNRKHQHTIMSILEKLQGFENEVDQYRSTVKDQMLLEDCKQLEKQLKKIVESINSDNIGGK